MKLNLGCGLKKLDDYINLDKDDFDLNNIPYPFKDNSIEELIISHVLEHLNNRLDVMIELNRVLKIGGILKVVLPIKSNIVNHKSYIHSKKYFNPLCMNRDIDGLQVKNIFRLQSFKRKRLKSFKNIIGDLKEDIISRLYNENEYILIKK